MSKNVEYSVNEAGTISRLVVTQETSKDWTPPSAIRVAELADIVITRMRQANGEIAYLAVGDKNGARRFVMALAEYDDPTDNDKLFEAIKKIATAITDDKPFRVEVDE
jgi:hypothetical protein